MTTTPEEEALAAFEAVTAAWQAEVREREWAETMRQCRACRAWVNRHLPVADLVRVCPNFNLCEGSGG